MLVADNEPQIVDVRMEHNMVHHCTASNALQYTAMQCTAVNH